MRSRAAADWARAWVTGSTRSRDSVHLSGVVDPGVDHLDEHGGGGDHWKAGVAGGGEPFVDLAVALDGLGRALAVQDERAAH